MDAKESAGREGIGDECEVTENRWEGMGDACEGRSMGPSRGLLRFWRFIRLLTNLWCLR